MLAQAVPTARASSVCRAQHLLRRAHPNGRIVELCGPARDVDSRFARGNMSSHLLPASAACIRLHCAAFKVKFKGVCFF